MSYELLWLIVAAILALIELIFGAFAAFCPAIGALCAAFIAFIGGDYQPQLLAMFGGGIISFMILGPIVKKHRVPSPENPTNMDAIIGRTAYVEIPYDGFHYGRAKIDGNSWQIVSADRSLIYAGTYVKVIAYNSIILTVEPLPEK